MRNLHTKKNPAGGFFRIGDEVLYTKKVPTGYTGSTLILPLFQENESLCMPNYSATIAPVGQEASQVPQSRHASASITYFPSPSEIASAGHSPAHVPHATHSSVITYAIIISSF